MPNIPELPFILLFVLISAVLGALLGLIKGARKPMAGITAIILAVITSLIATPIILKSVLTKENAMLLFDAVGFTETYNELVAASPSIEELLLGLPVAIIGPILFLLIYFVLRLIFRIITGIISKIIFKKKNFILSRLIGLPLGFVQGTLTAMVIVVILAGFISTVNNVTDTILEQESEQLVEVQASVEEVDQYVNLLAEDPIVAFLEDKNFIFDSLNSFDFKEEKVVLKDELSLIVEAGVYLVPVMENADIAQWSTDEFVAIDTFVDKFGFSHTLPSVASELLASACEKWSNGEEFMGIASPEVDETINPLLVALFSALKDSNSVTLVEDMHMLVDVLEVCAKYELFSKLSDSSEDIMSVISGPFISEFLTLISDNERFSVLIPEITNLSMRMLASALNLPENVEEVYGNITSELSTSLNQVLSSEATEEARQQFTKDVTDSLKNNGINVSEDVANAVADNFINAFEGKENVTQEDIKSYFEDYAAIYGKMENTDQNTSSADSTIKLTNTSGKADKKNAYDYKTMSFDDKIAALSAFGMLDYCKEKFDISAPNNVLNNGMTADQYVNYIITIYNSIAADNAISALGASDANPIVALKSPETMITTKITATDLMVSKDHKVSVEDIQNIADGFDSINEFLTSYNELGGSVSLDNIGSLDLAAAGKALDKLQNTSILGDKVGAIADTLVGDVMGTSISLSDKMTAGNVSYESLMTTVKSTANVISNISKEDQTDEEKEAAIVDLLLNLTEETSGIVSEIVTKDFMIQQGVPSEYASASADALSIALTEMAKLPEAEHDVEAAKIKHLIEISSAAKNSSKPMIGENGVFKTAKEMISMATDSKVASVTLRKISKDDNGNVVKDPLGIAESLSETDKTDIQAEVNSYYNESKTTMNATELSELKENLNALCIVFDIATIQ